MRQGLKIKIIRYYRKQFNIMYDTDVSFLFKPPERLMQTGKQYWVQFNEMVR